MATTVTSGRRSLKKSAPSKKRSVKKRIIWSMIILTVITGVVAAFFIIQGRGATITTATVETGDVAITVFATGALTSGESRDVYPETQGLIKAVLVADGDVVKKDDILATLDDSATQAQLSQARAALAQAQGGLAQAQSAQSSAGAGTAAAQAALTAAQAGLESARNLDSLSQQALTNAKNIVSLMQSSGAALTDPAGFAQAQAAVTQAEIAVAQATAGVAQANAGVAQARAALSQAQSANPAAAVAAARAAVDAARGGVELAETAVEATVIRAPIGGMVLIAPTPTAQAVMGTGVTPTGGMQLAQGSVVAPGSPLFTIVNEDALSFTAEIDEVDIRKIELEQSASITLSAFSGQDFPATVTRISNTAKPTITGGTVFDIELTFDGLVPEARIGMKGDTTIAVETQHNTLTIPVDAWFREAGVDFVWLVSTDNTLIKTPVTVGASTEFVVEVLDGVSAGDTVALATAATPFTEGLRVTPNP